MERRLCLSVAMVILLTFLAAGCAAPAPSPTAAPPKPAAPAPAAAPKPAATTAPAPAAAPKPAAPTAAPKPAATTAPAAKPAATAAPAAKQASGGTLTPLRWGVSINLAGMPIIIGVEKGIFNKHGLDVKVEILNAAAAINKALQVGEIDAGLSAIGGIISARSQDIPVRGFGILVGDGTIANTDNIFGIVAAPNSGVSKLADLSGKKVGVQAGTTLDTYLRNVLAAASVPVDKVQIQNVNQANSLAALTSGTDAVGTVEPYIELSLAKIPGSKLVVRGGGYIAQRMVVQARDEWLVKNRDVAERALLALVEAMQYTRQHPDETAAMAARWLAGGIEPEIMGKAIRHFDFDPRITKAVPESWVSEDKTMLDQKKIQRSISYAEGFDPALAEKIQKERPQYFTDLKPQR